MSEMDASTSTSTVQVNFKNEMDTIAASMESIRRWKENVNLVNQYDCSICYESYDKGSVGALKCGHIFHRNCLMQWFKLGTTCPKCNETSSMEDSRTVFLDNKSKTNSSNMNLILRPIDLRLVDHMMKMFEFSNTVNKWRLFLPGYLMSGLLVILMLAYWLCITTDDYIEIAYNQTAKNVIRSRYSKELEIYVEKNVTNVKYNVTTYMLRDEYIDGKGFRSLMGAQYAIVFGGYFGILFGAFSLIMFFLYKKLIRFRKMKEHDTIRFLDLTRELRKVYDTIFVGSHYCAAVASIYLIIIAVNVVLVRLYANRIAADYASLLEYTVKQFQLIVEQNREAIHVRSIDDIQREHMHELLTNKDQIYVNTFMTIFTAVGAFVISAMCSYVTLFPAFMSLQKTRKINKIIESVSNGVTFNS